MKLLARLKFVYFRENLVFSRSRFPPRESDESHSHSDMVRGLVPSMTDVSANPFWYDCRIGSYMIRYKGYCHSWNEGGWLVTKKLGLGMRAILIWMWDVFPHDHIWVHGHSDVIEGCVPTWSDIRVDAILLENGGTWSVTRNPQPGVESLSIMVAECVPAWVDVSAEPFHHGCRMCSRMGGRAEPF